MPQQNNNIEQNGSPITNEKAENWNDTQMKESKLNKLISNAVFLTVLLAVIHFVRGMTSSNMNVAVVCMTDAANQSLANNFSLHQHNNSGKLLHSEEVHSSMLDSYWKGQVIVAFQYGNLFVLFTGDLADRFPAHLLLLSGTVITALSNAFIPVSATVHAGLVVAFRVVSGIGSSLFLTATQHTITLAFDRDNRNLVLSTILAGFSLGNSMITGISGGLCTHNWPGFPGWTLIFYITAICGFFVSLLIFAYSILARQTLKQKSLLLSKKQSLKHKIPWRNLLTCLPLWAALFTSIIVNTALQLLNFIPTYYNDVCHMPYRANGLWNSLPAILILFFRIGVSWSYGWLSKKTNRRTLLSRVYQTIACLGIGISFIVIGALGCSGGVWATITLFTISFSIFASLKTPGTAQSLMCITPKYTGFVSSILFFATSVFAIAYPLAIESWKRGGATPWNRVLYVSGGMALLPIPIYNIWGSTDPEPWAVYDDNSNSNNNNNNINININKMTDEENNQVHKNI